MRKLGELVKVQAGQAAPKEFSSIGTPFVRAGHLELLLNGVELDDLPKVDEQTAMEKKLKILPSGSILFAKSGMSATKDRVYITDREVFFVSHLAAITPADTFNTSYLARYLKWFKPSSLIIDEAYPSIRLSDIAELDIPLPPLAEQQKIAAILDAADSLRQKDQQLLEHYTALSQSLFLEMFGDPVTNSMGWEQHKLKELCIKITDGTHHSPPLIETGIPYVTAKHVKSFGLDFMAKPTYITAQDHEEIYKRCSPEYGDVLYIKDGATTGIACLNTFHIPISLLSSLALLKVKSDKLNNYYLCYWLNHEGIKAKLIREYMSGAAIQRYTLTKINTFQLMLPSIDLQNQFAERIKLIEAQKQQAQANLEKSEALFSSLLHRAFTGELTQTSKAA